MLNKIVWAVGVLLFLTITEAAGADYHKRLKKNFGDDYREMITEYAVSIVLIAGEPVDYADLAFGTVDLVKEEYPEKFAAAKGIRAEILRFTRIDVTNARIDNSVPNNRNAPLMLRKDLYVDIRRKGLREGTLAGALTELHNEIHSWAPRLAAIKARIEMLTHGLNTCIGDF